MLLCTYNALAVAASARFSAPVTALSCNCKLACSDDAMTFTSEVQAAVLYPGTQHGSTP